MHRAKLRVDERHWQMARLDPRLWGDRQEVHVKEDWSKFTVEERERKALQILDMCRDVIEMRKEIERFKREGPRPIVYDPTDADELAGATAAEPSKSPVK